MDEEVLFSGHALQQMFRRGLTHVQVLKTLRTGEVIADYPEDKPYPSQLILSFDGSQPIHVVASKKQDQWIIITTYYPDSRLWEADYKTRRKP